MARATACARPRAVGAWLDAERTVDAERVRPGRQVARREREAAQGIKLHERGEAIEGDHAHRTT